MVRKNMESSVGKRAEKKPDYFLNANEVTIYKHRGVSRFCFEKWLRIHYLYKLGSLPISAISSFDRVECLVACFAEARNSFLAGPISYLLRIAPNLPEWRSNVKGRCVHATKPMEAGEILFAEGQSKSVHESGHCFRVAS